MRKSTALVLAAIAIVAVTLWGFQPEANAVAWHLRHGMHADGAGLRVRVPLLYSAMEGPTSVILMSQNGRVRTHFYGPQGVLVFIANKFQGTILGATPPSAAPSQTETVEQWWQHTSAAIERQGARQTSSRTLTVAGHAERCYEFEGGLLLLGKDVWCVPEQPGGWIVDYTGPSAHVPQFYSALESAQAR